MTSPVSNSPVLNTQAAEEKKKVSWGNNSVVIIEPSYHIPEGCSKTTEGYLAQLMGARSILKRALSQPESDSSKVHVMTILRNIISSTEGDKDPISQTICRVSHVLLARAYFGMFPTAFLDEMKIIETDPAMKKHNDQWPSLLTAESIFS